jgi:hypothetical protein
VARLKHALARIRAIPSDVGETHESVHRLLCRGGEMPYDGGWITGEGDTLVRDGDCFGRRSPRAADASLYRELQFPVLVTAKILARKIPHSP